MKIGYLTHDMNPKAGWGRYASDLIMGIKKAGHEVVILKEEDDGYEGVPILKRGAGMFSSAFRASRYLKDCDVIHALDVYPYGIIAYLASTLVKKKIIISAIGTYSVAPLYGWKTAYLSRLALRSSVEVTAISSFTRKQVLKAVDLKNISVINPSLDFAEFRKDHLDSNQKFILSVGALKRRKGYHVSIHAFKLAKKQIPNLKYKIIGGQADRNYTEKLKKIVRDEGIENDVEFMSDISDDALKKIYSEAKLFILTSINEDHHFEGFGLVFLEAAAAGLPVVGTLDNGIEDAVASGKNGILVNQNDVVGTAEAIVALLNDGNRWTEMSNNSYEWAKAHDTRIITNQYIDLYKKIVK